MPTVVAISAVYTVILFAHYVTHIPANLYQFYQYLKSHKNQEHRSKVANWTIGLPTHFKNWMEQTQKMFIRDLTVGEFKKVGLPFNMTFHNGHKIESALQTMERVLHVMKDFKSPNFVQHLQFNINEGEERVRFSTQADDKNPNEVKVTVEIAPQPDERGEQIFFLKEGYLSDLVKDGSLVDNVSIELSGEDSKGEIAFLYRGYLRKMDFTKEELLSLQTALVQNKKYQKIFDQYVIDPIMQAKGEGVSLVADPKDSVDTHLSSLEKVTRMVKKGLQNADVVRAFFLSFATYNNTQKFNNAFWNGYFLFRSMLFNVLYPHRLISLVFFPRYFTVNYNEKLMPSEFNGGHRTLFSDGYLRAYPSGRKYLEALKGFEQQIIPIERVYLRASAEQAYLLAMQNAVQDSVNYDMWLKEGLKQQGGRLGYLPTNDLTDKRTTVVSGRDPLVSEAYQALMSFEYLPADTPSRKDSFFIEMVQSRLLKESVRSFIKEQLGLSESASDQEVQKRLREKLKQGPLNLGSPESLDKARDRVRQVAKDKQVVQTIANNMASWRKGLLEKLKFKHDKAMSSMFDPTKNRQMERIQVSQELGKDPEAMARASRFAGVKILIDKPIEVLVLLLMLTGVTEGIIRPLYSEPFSENSFFYLSVYMVWFTFFTSFVYEALGASWDKLQTDARFAFQDSAFDRLPTKEDLKKRFSALKYYASNAQNIFGPNKTDPAVEKNSFWNSYKHGVVILTSNLVASLPTYALFMAIFLNRFDIEGFITGLLFFTFAGPMAILIKTDGVYELSAGYASRKMMKMGVNVKRFLHHPAVQMIMLKEAFKDRVVFNFLNSLTFNNLIENTNELVTNLSTMDGSRAITRLLPSGQIFTEYLDKVTEQTARIFSTASDLCKKAFTNKRLDLGGD